MTALRCDRCGTLFDPQEAFTTANIDVLDATPRETIDQVLLCESCADAVGDSLSLETSEHGRS